MQTSNQILSAVKAKLEKVIAGKDNSFLARCPAHKDDKSSLSVSVGKHNDRVVLFCHAGCRFEDVVERLGMKPADLYVKRGKKKIIALYDYLDAEGKLKHQTVRFDNKDFSQRRPDGNGDWIWSLKGVRPILYRLSELLASTDLIYIVEGEKDADRLISLNLTATTNPMGAGKWRDQYSMWLKDRDVVIIPDRDKAGLAHASDIAVSIYDVALSVKILELPVAEHGDISDWLDRGGTSEELTALVEATAGYVFKAEPKNDSERLIAAVEAGTVKAAFGVVDVLSRMDASDYGIAKSQLKDNCPKLNLNDISKAVKIEHTKRQNDRPSTPVKSKGPPAPPATLDDVIQAFKKYLYFTDDSAIKISLAVIVANFMKGDPVWLMVVAPPSVGKTEIIEPIGGLWEARVVSTITEAGLLPAGSRRDRAKNANDGLLRELGDFGIIILKDFGSILSMNMESRAPVLAALREIYDGHWSRIVGTDGGQVIEWKGKIGIIGATTDSIDRHHGVMATLGERFVFYRVSEREEKERADYALQSIGNETNMREDAIKKIRGLIDNLDVKDRRVKLDADERRRINALARFTAHCRSPSGRDPRTHEVIMKPGTEGPTRLVKVFALIYTAMQVLGISDTEAWKLLRRIGSNSMPKIRYECLEALVKSKNNVEMSTREVAEAVDLPTSTVRRSLYDLTSHKVISRLKKTEYNNATNFWALSEWTAKTREEFS
jgi:hypothetical protein